MRTLRLPLAITMALSAFCSPVYADWESVWDDVTDYVDKESSAAGDQLKGAWDKLGVNGYLQLLFGADVDEHSALVGTFYDLKQPVERNNPHASKRKKKDSAEPDPVQVIAEFTKKNWDTKVLEKYYSPDVRLYAPYFYLPRCRAAYAPVAFQCAENVQPSRWVALYRGVVKAPKSGKFRFVGMGDDTLMVRFNKKQVFEYGWSIPSEGDVKLGTNPQYWQEITTRRKNPAALYRYAETPHWNKSIGGLASGTVFEVEEGEAYPIEILISEIPGAEFGYALLIEEVTDNPPHGIYEAEQAPILHLFRTNKAEPTENILRQALNYDGTNYQVGNRLECPPFLQNSPVWEVDYEKAEKAGFMDRLLEKWNDRNETDTAMGKQKRKAKADKAE